MQKFRLSVLCAAFVFSLIAHKSGQADYYATANNGEIYRFTRTNDTFQQESFVDLGQGQLSGLVYSPTENVLYASMLSSGKIYRINMDSSFQSLSVGTVSFTLEGLATTAGIAPSGLAVNSQGILHVATFADSLDPNGYGVYRLTGSDFESSSLEPITGTGGPGSYMPYNGGVGFLEDDQMVVSTSIRFGESGVYLGPANAQIAISPDSESYFVGSTQLLPGETSSQFSNIYQFDVNGQQIGEFEITDSLIPDLLGVAHLGQPSNPSGVAFDADGNLAVSVLGSNSLSEAKGALFLFSTTDFTTPLASWHGNLALSNVVYVPTAVPEPGSMAMVVVGGLGALAGYRRRRKKGALEAGKGLAI